MGYKPWQLAAMEESGYMDTNISLIHRVANFLPKSSNDTIEPEEFRRACVVCGVDPDSFTQSDLNQLQALLNEM